MEQDRMACFMISCDLFLFIRDDLALLFCTDPNLDECFLDILLHDIRTTLFCSINGSFVKKVLQICACKSCGCLGDLAKIHIISQRFVLGMDHKDLFSALDIRRPTPTYGQIVPDGGSQDPEYPHGWSLPLR